jgi:CIC family chloride channel protein
LFIFLRWFNQHEMVSQKPILNKLLPLFERGQINESMILSVVALLVGVSSGAAVWVFKQMIGLVHLVAFDWTATGLQSLGAWTVVIVPTLGGLVVGLIIYYFVGEERHHGVAGIMEAVALAGGRLRYYRMPAKAIVSALGIGAGASVGPEDPSVQIGANLGSMLGQWLHISEDRLRALVAAGAAAGIAAAFNAPIAGVFFALEIVLGEIGGSALGMIVVAAVISAVFTQAVSGPQPAFNIPSYAFHSIDELPLYIGLGILAGPIAAGYIRALYRIQDIFYNWQIPRWVKPAAAGLLVGITGIFLPQIFGVGYDSIELTLTNQHIAFSLLLALLIAKLLMTAISIGGGFLGGVFAPSLYLGAMLGALYGEFAALLFPSMTITPSAFAMVGMAAMLAGSVHAPLTAILLLFEMTNDYRIILPLMFAVVISMLISQRLQRDSVYTLGLARKGIRLERGRDVEVMQAIRVEEVMETNVSTFKESDDLDDASKIFIETHHHGLPVVNESNELVGILTLQDIDRAHQSGKENLRVGEACTRDLLIAYPDETMGAVLRRMSTRAVGRLPVVERDNPRHIVGLLRRTDIIRAYDLALTRRAVLRHRAHQVRLGAMSDEAMTVTEVQIDPEAFCTGKRISEIKWPHDCVIATLRRGHHFVIPHGDTVLHPGDVIVAVAEGEAREILIKICKTAQTAPVSESIVITLEDENPADLHPAEEDKNPADEEEKPQDPIAGQKDGEG